MLRPIVSHHIPSQHITLCHITSHHITPPTFFDVGEVEEEGEHPGAACELVVLLARVVVHHVLLTQLIPRLGER